MRLVIQIAVGLLLSGLVGYAAYRRESLSRSGVVGAVVVGTAIFGFGGWAWGLTLITFFVTSSLLSHYKEQLKAGLAEKFDKGHQRDLGQALANGGAGALIAAAYAIRPDPLLAAAFAGAMAAVNADTWATELGVLARRPPRLITSWREVEVGTSGGVTAQGTLAALGGALVIGAAMVILLRLECVLTLPPGVRYLLDPCPIVFGLIPVAMVGGLAGSLFDSLLGATVQAIYYSVKRQKETEKRVDPDGAPNTLRRGWAWLNNDLVNFIASLFGAAVAAGVWALV